MKVGVNARTFTVDEPDGAVQTAISLTSNLAKRNDIDLVIFGDESLRDVFPKATVRSAGFVSDSPFFGVVWERTILPFLVEADEIDVLLCPNGNAPSTPLSCSIVTYVHDVNAQKGMSSGIHRFYRTKIMPLGIRNSDSIITVSEFSKKEITEYLPVDDERVTVVYNGIDEYYLNDDESEEFDLPTKYLLYVGAMNPRKNIGRLIETYEKIKHELPHKLVLIGPGNKSVYKKFDVESLSDGLITPGFLPKEQLKYAYENADVFVYPSLYEGFGLPPLEAMACGTPVIASNRGSLPEILNGYCDLIDPLDADAIASAVRNEISSNQGQEEANALKQYAQRFTWEQATQDLYDVLVDTCNV